MNSFKSSEITWCIGTPFVVVKPSYCVGCYHNFTGGSVMICSFFGTGHGKGTQDEIGAVIKRFLQEQLKCSFGAFTK